LKKPLLLLVDDESEVLEMLEEMLDEDFDLRRADSAAKAVEILDREDAIALAIVDYMMPGGNGLDVARALIQRKRSLPVILYSAYLESELGDWTGDLRVRVLCKADGPEELKNAVRELIEPPAGA
jgi:CheY-like chemotaxis protein